MFRIWKNRPNSVSIKEDDMERLDSNQEVRVVSSRVKHGGTARRGSRPHPRVFFLETPSPGTRTGAYGLLPQRQSPCRRSKNVVQVATNLLKFRKESEQKREKRLTAFCCKLLLFSGLRRLRQDLVNLIARLEGRRPL
jgi:hypothetical protein